MRPTTRAVRGSLLIAAAVLVVDQITKWWALRALADGPIDVFWTLRLNLVFNTGAAFGQGEGFGPVIAVVGIVIVIGLLIALQRGVGQLNWVGVGLVVGGAVGNLIDRLTQPPGGLRGGVIDFVDFQWFPVFNVADMAINIGALILILSAFRARETPGEQAPVADD